MDASFNHSYANTHTHNYINADTDTNTSIVYLRRLLRPGRQPSGYEFREGGSNHPAQVARY